MRTITLFFSFVIALSFVSGCGDTESSRRPADLPKLYPVTITITQEGTPLEGADVGLTAKTPTKYGSSTGETDASGIAKPRTYGFAGVPAGQYVVTVSKNGLEGAQEKFTEEEGIPYMAGGKNYSYVDEQYWRDRSNTPLSIEVTDKGVTETFDVGAPVHVFLGNN